LLFGPESSDSGDKFDVGSTKRSRHGNSGAGAAREVGDTASPLKVLPTRDGAESDSDRPHKSTGASRDGRPRIEADPSLNALMIYDNVSKREMYRSLIAQLDVEPEQIEIEALIVDIERSKLAEMGVEWGVRRGDTISRVNATGSDSRGVELPIPGATLLISNVARFYARLKALEGSGEARVLAKPTVLTLDNVAAVLDLSQTSYVPLVGERVAELADITAGTMLRVVPRIVREGDNTRVRLEIDIEDGSLGEPGLKSSVTRSTISTQAIIDLQQTLMIGGYHTESMSRNKQQVPVLGDVPVFGNLFRSESQSHGSRERLFLITPRLAGTVGSAAPAESKATRAARKVALTEGQSYTNPRLSNLPGAAGDASMNLGTPVASPAPTTPAALPAQALPLESKRPRGQAAEPPSRESIVIDADPDFEFLARPVSRPVPERIGGGHHSRH
jgi:type III secretion protein C